MARRQAVPSSKKNGKASLQQVQVVEEAVVFMHALTLGVQFLAGATDATEARAAHVAARLAPSLPCPPARHCTDSRLDTPPRRSRRRWPCRDAPSLTIERHRASPYAIRRAALSRPPCAVALSRPPCARRVRARVADARPPEATHGARSARFLA